MSLLLPVMAGDTVMLATPVNPSANVISPGTATATYSLLSTGKVSGTAMGTAQDWVLPNGHASNYECFATLNSGTLTSGTTGSWLALSSTRTWTKNRATLGVSTAQITVQIRKVGTTTVLATAVVTLTAEVDSRG